MNPSFFLLPSSFFLLPSSLFPLPSFLSVSSDFSLALWDGDGGEVFRIVHAHGALSLFDACHWGGRIVSAGRRGVKVRVV